MNLKLKKLFMELDEENENYTKPIPYKRFVEAGMTRRECKKYIELCELIRARDIALYDVNDLFCKVSVTEEEISKVSMEHQTSKKSKKIIEKLSKELKTIKEKRGMTAALENLLDFIGILIGERKAIKNSQKEYIMTKFFFCARDSDREKVTGTIDEYRVLIECFIYINLNEIEPKFEFGGAIDEETEEDEYAYLDYADYDKKEERIKCLLENEPYDIFASDYAEWRQEAAYLKTSDEKLFEDVQENIKWENQRQYDSSTLYIHKGVIKCQLMGHYIESTTAIVKTLDDKDVLLNINHCMNCGFNFLSFSEYKKYIEEYKFLLKNFLFIDENSKPRTSFLDKESPLMLSGYRVKRGVLTEKERIYTLSKLMASKSLRKDEIIKYLTFFIETLGSKKDNYEARQKWEHDLKFVREFNIDKQEKIEIMNLEKYKKK